MKGVVEGARRSQAAVEACLYLLLITLSLNSASASLAVIRFQLVLFIIIFLRGKGGYAGVFRISEVLSIRLRDVFHFLFHEGLTDYA